MSIVNFQIRVTLIRCYLIGASSTVWHFFEVYIPSVRFLVLKLNCTGSVPGEIAAKIRILAPLAEIVHHHNWVIIEDSVNAIFECSISCSAFELRIFLNSF
jgi:hypothetical protein